MLWTKSIEPERLGTQAIGTIIIRTALLRPQLLDASASGPHTPRRRL